MLTGIIQGREKGDSAIKLGPACPHRPAPPPPQRLSSPTDVSCPVPGPQPVPSSRGVRHVRPFLSESPVPALQETILPVSAQGSPPREGVTGPLPLLSANFTLATSIICTALSRKP